MELLAVKSFETGVDAHILKTKLSSQGVQSFIFDENIVSLNPLYNLMVGGIKVMVSRSDFDKARKVVEEIEGTSLTDDNDEEIKCPVCGSMDLYHGFKSMRGLAGALSAAVSIFLGVIPLYFKTVCKCKVCNNEFKQA